MSDLPEPLVSGDVDLRTFPYMPLDVARLRDSDLAALVSAEAFRAAVILWCVAWHQVPAASLPDDDQALSRLAGYGRDLAGWRKAKDGALRGFMLCSDGRFYHPVIAQKAMTAWESKQAQLARTAAATAARLAKQQGNGVSRNERRDDTRDVSRNEPRDVARSDKRHETRDERPDENVTCTNRDRDRDRDRDLKKEYARDARACFDQEFWPKYPNKVGKPVALKAFEKLYREMDGIVAPILCGLERYIAAKPADRAWMNPATFLNQRRFEDQPAIGAATPTATVARIDFGGGVSWPEKSVIDAMHRWRDDPTTWPSDRIGPPPGSPGCRVPERLLQAA